MYRGPDNLVPVLESKTESWITKRSVTQVCPLPIPTNTELSPHTEIEVNIENLDNNEIDKSSSNSLIEVQTSNENLIHIRENLIVNNICIDETEKNLKIKSKPTIQNCKDSCPINNNENIRQRTYINFRKTGPFIFFIFVLMIPVIIANNSLNVTYFVNKSGLYFENMGKTSVIVDKWHIITFYNLSDHWNQINLFKKMLTNTRPLCNLDVCNASMQEIEKHMHDIDILENDIREE